MAESTRVHVLTCTETFKGTLEAEDVGKVCIEAITKLAPETAGLTTRNLPLSDGGAGFLSAMKKALPNLEIKSVQVQGPNATVGKVMASYGEGILETEEDDGARTCGKFLVVEMAAACGLPFIPDESKRDPLAATSAGLGELISAAIQAVEGKRSCSISNEEGGNSSRSVPTATPVKKIYLGLGGTATNDGAIPALVSLGALQIKSMDSNHHQTGSSTQSSSSSQFLTGGDLTHIREVEVVPDALEKLTGGGSRIEVVLVTDVNNPLLGSNGATQIFGPQKGATTPEIREVLERGLENCAKLIQEKVENNNNNRPSSTSCKLTEIPGGGAAGGAGCFLSSVLSHCTILPGAEAFAQIVGLKSEVEKADLIITGEGSFDSQTLENGKTIDHVRQLCFEAKKPLMVVCGRNLVPESQWADRSRSTIFTVCPLTPKFSVEEAMSKTANCLTETVTEAWPTIVEAVPLLVKKEE